MASSVAKRTATAVEKPTQDPLPALAAKIERHHKATYRALGYGLDRALRCGDCLIEAKGLVKHGEWLPWLKANTTIGARQAQNYMNLARNRAEIEAGKYATDSHLPIREAVALLAKPSEPVEEDDDESKPDEDEPEDEPEWYAVLNAPLGAKVGRGRKTKAEAEKDAEEWRQHNAGLERKPRGEVCVITADKLHAMSWSCSVTPETTEAEDAAIVKEAKVESFREGYLAVVQECLSPSELDAELDLIRGRLREIAKRKGAADT
jgi:Protein of unknown function (DUF3102)